MNKREKGVTLVLFSLLISVFLGFTALSVDLGYLFLIRHELQKTADAAALAGAYYLPNTSTALSKAQQIAQLNFPNQGTVLQSADVLFGTWNASTNTFTTTNTNPSAISVTVRKSQSSQNAVTLFFAPIFGISTRDVSATAIATQNSTKFPYAVVGMNSINMSGGTFVDSYNSAQGSYGGSNIAQRGDAATNGTITLSGSALIKGNATAGQGYSIGGGTVGVTGTKTTGGSSLTYSPLPAPTTYNNNGLGSSLSVTGSSTVSMSPGTYLFSTLKTSGSGKIKISGPTTIYVSGSVSLSGAGIISGTQNPADLTIILTSTATSVVLSGSAYFYGVVYAPKATLSISGASQFFGAFVGKTISLTGSGQIHRDENLKFNPSTGSSSSSRISLVK